jgi:LacI family transcriptional regulator
MRANWRPTAQDVADLAGVSRSSVSLVLNGRGDGNLRADKQVAILEAARQLNYRPNAVALSLRSQRTLTLGVLTWRGNSGFPQEMLHSTLETANAAGYLTLFMDTPDGQDFEHRAVSALLDRQVDAILVVAPELVEYPIPEILGSVQKILINCADPEATVTSIVPDELGAAACAAQILIDHGHTRIALLSDMAPTSQARDRSAGVHQALADAGLAAPRVYRAGATIQAAFALARQALQSDQRPTALVCSRERHALGALLAVRDLGLDVPTDVSLISLDDGEGLASDLVPVLATVQRPDRAMAEQAVALLLHEINSPGAHDVRQLSFACPARLGASVAVLG